MANDEHLARLNQGVASWNAWFNANSGPAADLRGANLRGDRRRPGRTRGFRWMVLLLALIAGPASAQPVSPACDERCAPSDLLCTARRHVCQSKLDFYGGYMAALGRGVVMHALPPQYEQLLQPHFPAIDLGSYRFGFGDRQPPGNAITDCDRTYFGDVEFVERLRAGDLSEDAHLDWLFHELAHVQQCREAGGRDHYARMWFGDLGTALLGSLNPLTLHERMPMERRASDEARRALDAVSIMRDGQGRLFRPEQASSASVPACPRSSGSRSATGRP